MTSFTHAKRPMSLDSTRQLERKRELNRLRHASLPVDFLPSKVVL